MKFRWFWAAWLWATVVAAWACIPFTSSPLFAAATTIPWGFTVAVLTGRYVCDGRALIRLQGADLALARQRRMIANLTAENLALRVCLREAGSRFWAWTDGHPRTTMRQHD